MQKAIFFLTCFCLYGHVFSQTLSIQDAAKDKKITYTLTGSWNRDSKEEFSDPDGQYYGKCMLIRIQSQLRDTVELYIESGLMLLCEDTLTQDMVITQSMYVTLFPKKEKVFRLYAMCSEIHDYVPHSQKKYTIGQMADENLTAIAHTIDNMYMQNRVGQGAVWAYTDSASDNDLLRYGASTESLDMTVTVLNKAGVFTPLNPKPVQAPPVNLPTAPTQSPEKGYLISIPFYAVFIAGGILLLWMCLILFVLVRKPKNQRLG